MTGHGWTPFATDDGAGAPTAAPGSDDGGRPVGRAPGAGGADTAGQVAAEAVDRVRSAALAARAAAATMAAASAATVDGALRAIADRLLAAAPAVLAANERDVAAARSGGVTGALVDRLRLDGTRIAAIADQLRVLADVPVDDRPTAIRDLPGGLVATERRRPVGVIGANFEARPNVAVDVASQLLKSRNAGVLRTGSAALASVTALVDEAVAPGLRDAGLDAAAVQLVRMPGQAAAHALVRQADLIPLVIVRGSGASTRALAHEAAAHGVRTLAHADGGAVIYLHSAADPPLADRLVAASLDRLGVCNRLNLLLVDGAAWDATVPRVTAILDRLGIVASLPPHDHPLGHEWALQVGHEATVTLAPVAGAAEAAAVANEHTSGLAAAIVTEDPTAAAVFLDGYSGTGAFWNATPRLLDGFKLLGLPETGINIDKVPGPRGPVTFRDLCLRQFVVVPGRSVG